MNPNHLNAVPDEPGNPFESFALPKFPKEAECANGVDPDIFFSENLGEIAEAKALCAKCPIQAMCLEWAMRWEQDGVWGGTTPAERKKLRGGKPAGDPIQARLKAEHHDVLVGSKSVREKADFFGVTPRTIYRWLADERNGDGLENAS